MEFSTDKFLTNVGLITSNGPYGQNIMACEWTHCLSYGPMLIAVCVGKAKATFANIKNSGYFGVNIAAFDQNYIASIAGNNSGKNLDKIKVLQELGVKFYKAENFDIWMIEGAAMNAECKVVGTYDLGDHPMFVGKVVKIADSEKTPIAYHQGRYFQLGEGIAKPPVEMLEKIKLLVQKYQKSHEL